MALPSDTSPNDRSADRTDSQTRLFVLRQLIREGLASTQDDLVKSLKQKKFKVTQSTISRDLRRIGAIKAVNSEGDVIYRLPDEGSSSVPMTVSNSLGDLLTDIQFNDSMVVLHTSPGSASLVARHLDSRRASLGILGTIAGDDTIFIAPLFPKKIPALIQRIKDEF